MNAFEIFAVLGLNSSGYERGLQDAENKGSSFGSKLKSGLGAAAKVAGAALGAASTAVVAFAKSSVETGMQFDSSMSQVAATMGTTVDQIQDLSDFAQEMGSKTAFSATQAADALNYMALAGYDADTSMKMLPNVLNLAAAGGMELASASDMITDSQSALGLTLDETSQLVDKMAKASSKSNTSVAQLGEAILTVGGTAKNLAGGTTELSTALGILADNGVKGAEGGTALRNIILSLSAPTDTAAKAMKSLGLNAFDADGNMRPLNETFGDLDKALSTMTQGEQTQVLNKIFNKVDLKSVNALLANTIGSFENIEGAIKDTGVNWEKYDVSAETALQNAAYMLESLGLSAEEAQKQLSLEMNIDAADALATVNVAFEELNKGAFTTKTRFDELSGYIDGAWYSIESLDKALKETGSISLSQMQANLKKLGVTSEEFTAALDASGGVAEVFAEEIWAAADATASNEELSNAMSASLGELQKAFDNTTGSAQAMADTQLDNLAGDVTIFQSALEGAKNTLSKQLTPTLRKFVKFGSDGISKITDGFKSGGLSGAMSAFGTVLSNGILMITGMLPDIVEAGSQVLTAFVNGITQNIEPITNAALSIAMTLFNALAENAPKLLEAGITVLQTLMNGISQNIGSITETIVQLVVTIAQILTNPENLTSLLGAALQIVTGLAQGILNALPTLINALPTIINNIVNFFLEALPMIIETGVQLLTALVDNLPTIIDAIVEVLPQIIDGIVNALSDNIDKIIDAGIKLLTSLIDDLPKIIDTIVTALPKLVDGIANGIIDNIDKIIEAGVKLLVAIVSDVPRIVSGIVLKIPEIIQSIVDGFGEHMSEMGDVGKRLLEGLWEGIKNAGEWLKDKIGGFFGGIVDGIKGFFGIHSPSTLMEDQIGKMLALGVGVGFDKEMIGVTKDMQNALPTEFDTDVKANVGFEEYTGTVKEADSAIYRAAGATEYRTAAQSANGSVSATQNPILVVVQLEGGIELGRKLIDLTNQAKRVEGRSY